MKRRRKISNVMKYQLRKYQKPVKKEKKLKRRENEEKAEEEKKSRSISMLLWLNVLIYDY
jgi:hypothetical protein